MTTTTTVPIYKSAAGEQAGMALFDQMLERWPVPYTSIMLATRHGDTFVIASGPSGAPPVILLHGASSNALAWMGDVQAYSSMLRVYAVDLPGEPGRSSHTRPPWPGPAYVEWMEDVLDGLGSSERRWWAFRKGDGLRLSSSRCNPSAWTGWCC